MGLDSARLLLGLFFQQSAGSMLLHPGLLLRPMRHCNPGCIEHSSPEPQRSPKPTSLGELQALQVCRMLPMSSTLQIVSIIPLSRLVGHSILEEPEPPTEEARTNGWNDAGQRSSLLAHVRLRKHIVHRQGPGPCGSQSASTFLETLPWLNSGCLKPYAKASNLKVGFREKKEPCTDLSH